MFGSPNRLFALSQIIIPHETFNVSAKSDSGLQGWKVIIFLFEYEGHLEFI